MACTCGGHNEALFAQLDEVIEQHKDMRGSLISVLHKAQGIFGYLPEEVQAYIAEKMDVSVQMISNLELGKTSCLQRIKSAILELQAGFRQSQPFKKGQAAAVPNRMPINGLNTCKELNPGSKELSQLDTL